MDCVASAAGQEQMFSMTEQQAPLRHLLIPTPTEKEATQSIDKRPWAWFTRVLHNIALVLTKLDHLAA